MGMTPRSLLTANAVAFNTRAATIAPAAEVVGHSGSSIIWGRRQITPVPSSQWMERRGLDLSSHVQPAMTPRAGWSGTTTTRDVAARLDAATRENRTRPLAFVDRKRHSGLERTFARHAAPRKPGAIAKGMGS